MDVLSDIWTERGLLNVQNGVPTAIQSAIWVELGDVRSAPTTDGRLVAALIELTTRLGLHLLSMPETVLGELFVDPLASLSNPSTPRAPGAASNAASLGEVQVVHGGCRMVLATSEDWLRSVIPPGPGLDAVCAERLTLDSESGLVTLVNRHYLVVTATSTAGLLATVRYLVSEASGRGLPNTKQVRVASSEGFWSATGDSVADNGSSGLQHTDDSSGKSVATGLEDLCSTDGLYRDTGEALPTLRVTFAVQARQAAVASLLKLAAKLALGAGSVHFPITELQGIPNVTSPSVISPAHALEFIITDALNERDTPQIQLRGDTICFTAPSEASLAELVDGVIASWFDDRDDVFTSNWQGKLAAWKSTHPDVALRARAEMALALEMSRRPFTNITASQSLGVHVQRWCSRHQVALAAQPAPVLWTVNWTDAGELKELEQRFWDIWPTIGCEYEVGVGDAGPGDASESDASRIGSIEVEFVTSVSEPSFRRFADAIRVRLKQTVDLKFVYRDANKAGLFWLLSDVMPQLERLDGVASIHVSARRFERGAEFLDLPQRFLQELFPADAIIAKRLGLRVEQVELALHGKDGPMFRVVATDDMGRELGQWSWDGLTEVLEYMPFEDLPRYVCAPSAGLRIARVQPSGERETVAVESVATNYTRFWVWFQREVVHKLPSTVASLGAVTDDTPAGPTPFQQLSVNVFIDGSEFKTGIHEEFTSFPEALHEDVYFYTLHALQTHGRAVGETGWDSPGSIVPYIHICEGAPHATVQLFGYDRERTLTLSDGDSTWGITVGVDRKPPEDVHVQSIAWTKQGWVVEALSTGPNDVPSVWPANPRTHSISNSLGFAVEELRTWLNQNEPANGQSHRVPEWQLMDKGQDPIKRFAPDMARDILHNTDVEDWIADKRDRIPGNAWPVEYSFQGRPIWALELMHPVPAGQMTSRAKHSLYKPTLFITARHHANEASSTNSALWLLDKLVDDPALLHTFNLVIVPLQNVDGAALHAQLVEEHPNWKHHAARFNACGFEFARHYFHGDTPFGESRTMQVIWDLWKPDIYLDDHGIPSHEWIQPFSGYNSPPSFPVSYWIPHAQMYTIWHYPKGEHPSRDASLSARIARRLADDRELHSVNQEFLKRYLRWGHEFAPERFPVETEDDVITYRHAIDRDAGSRLLIARFQELVTADIVTEVNDETVHDDALYSVARAHSLVHAAMLEWLAAVDVRIQRDLAVDDNGGVVVSVRRQRPLTIYIRDDKRRI